MRSCVITGARIICLALALLACASPTVLLATSGCDDRLTIFSADDGKVNDKSAAPDDASSLESRDLSDLATVSRPQRGSTVGGFGIPTSQKAHNAYGRLPISFERNDGQTNPRVRFLSRNSGYNLFLTDNEAVLSMQTDARETSDKDAAGSSVGSRRESIIEVLRMKLLGASRRARSSGVDPLPGKANYILGGDQKDWRRNAPTYGKVKFEAVYPGVDLLYYGNQRQIEYDFVVSPGGDPNRIKLAFRGATNIRVDANGDLVLRLASREIRQLAPNAYQEIDGVKRSVACRYIVGDKNRVHFKLGSYDRSRTVVIDPIVSYSTYLGGASVDAGYSIAVGTESDGGSYAYITGLTRSLDFPTTAGAYQPTLVGAQNDVFVTKLNQDGTGLVYSTYIGGDNNDIGYSIAVDAAGQAFVAGATESPDFPTTPGAYQEAMPGVRSAFLVKLRSAGDGLVFSTFLGGQLEQEAYGVALNGSTVYVAGWTTSSDFPITPGAFQTSCNSGCDSGFVTRFHETGSFLDYSTYFGFFGHCRIKGIAVDAQGYALVTGFGSGLQGQDGFVAKLFPQNGAFAYIRTLAGEDIDACNAIAVDSSGNAYVTGETISRDFPSTFGDHNFGMRRGQNAFVTKVDPQGAIVYSKFLEGNGDDIGRAIAVDADGATYVAGSTTSLDFPVSSDALQSNSERGASDAFIAKLSASGATVDYSTYWGGGGEDLANGVALDAVNNVYATGTTSSFDFPITTGALRSSNSGSTDAFVLKIGMGQEGFAISGQVTNNLNNPLIGVPVYVAGALNRTVHTDDGGNYSSRGLAPGGSFTLSAQRGSFVFSPTPFEFPSLSQNETLNFTGPAPLEISGTIIDNQGNPTSASVTISGSASATVQTDEFGHYVFNDLAQGGDYTVTPSHPSYTFFPASTSVTGLSGDIVLRFVKETVTISGRITDQSGNPVNATVSLSGDSNQTVETDAQGRYSFYGNPTGGNYTVTPSKSSYTFSPASQSISNAGSSYFFDFIALPPVSIYGRVINGAEGVTLTLSGGINDTQVTDLSGAYGFYELPRGGTYTVTPSHPLFDFFPESQTFTNMDTSQELNFTATFKRYTVSGRVTDPGGVGIDAVTISSSGYSTTITDASGNYSLSDLPAGATFIVTPSKAHYSFSPASADVNNLSENSVVDFAGTLLTHSISGRVVDGGGSGLAGVSVSLTGSQPGSATTDANGNFAFLSLAGGGSYTVTPSLAFYSFRPGSLTFDDLGANQTANIAGARLAFNITGRVMEDAVGVAGVTITLSGAQSAGAVTDGLGEYSFAGLPAGYDYNLTASSPYFVFSPASWTVVSLNGNQIANFAAARLTYQVNGVVQDVCARPIAGATMTLTHNGIPATATTDSSGQYSFSGAPAGYNYSLTPTKAGYAFTPVSASYANLNSNQAANFTGTPATTSADLAPTADSYVRGASGANTNFGSATELITRLANAANNTFETYLTFNLGQPCTVSSVKLELFGGLSGTSNNVQVSAYAVSNTTWTETGLTWNNRPPAGSLLSTTIVLNSTPGWYEWDITSYAQSEIAAGRSVISIVLKNPTTSNQVIFNSREATTYKPKLVVVTP